MKTSLKNIMITGGCVLLSFSAYANNLLKNGNAETKEMSWKPNIITITNEDKQSGNSGFLLEKPAMAVYSELIPVDTSKTYKISGFLKSKNAKNLSASCFGIAMYDKNKRVIMGVNVDAVQGSDTVVVNDVVKGAKEIVVKNAKKWNKRYSTRSMVVFNTKNDLSDLPNYNTSSLVGRVKKIKKSDNWLVKLRQPLTKDLKAGTNVRQHLYSSSLNACLAYRGVPAKWTSYSATIGGEANAGAPNTKFWKGTKFIAIYFIADAARKNSPLLLDDIVFEEIVVDKEK